MGSNSHRFPGGDYESLFEARTITSVSALKKHLRKVFGLYPQHKMKSLKLESTGRNLKMGDIVHGAVIRISYREAHGNGGYFGGDFRRGFGGFGGFGYGGYGGCGFPYEDDGYEDY